VRFESEYIMVLILAGLLVFSVFHSLTAGRSFKSRFRSMFGERAYHGWYRLVYNVIAVVSVAPIALAVWLQEGRIIWEAPAGLQSILLIIQVVGAIGLLVSFLQIDMGQFTGLSQAYAYLNNHALPLPAETLQQGGVYKIVRHPLYFFSLLTLWTITPLTDIQFAFNLGATLYFVIGSRYEEQKMLAIFGDDYETYRQKVPWLFPMPHRWW
jgi:protein-S-isoprenylcysteine O-methyltransferase Ste14